MISVLRSFVIAISVLTTSDGFFCWTSNNVVTDIVQVNVAVPKEISRAIYLPLAA